jgi:serine palmitoyltransferase
MILPNVYEVGFRVGQALKNVLTVESCPTSFPNMLDVWKLVLELPYMYKEWWWNLVTNDPIHVAVETTLLVSVVYMSILSRNKDYRFSQDPERLSWKEQEDLLQEWKESRGDLAPAKVLHKDPIVVHAFHGRTMEITMDDNNSSFINTNSSKSNPNKSSQQTSITTVLNMATYDFLSMSCNEELKNASRTALQTYGCGSCGPRGFYGTIDVHLQLEQAMAQFTNTEGAIMYSDGASTVTSTIAAFAKRGDLLVVDDGVYEPIVTGVTLSRANVEWFQHNNMVCNFTNSNQFNSTPLHSTPLHSNQPIPTARFTKSSRKGSKD